MKLVPRLPVPLREFAIQRKRREWVEEKNMLVFSVYNPKDPLEHIDVKIDNPNNLEGYLNRAKTVVAGDLQIPVVSLDDLICLKEEAGRERDLVDIRALKRLKEIDER